MSNVYLIPANAGESDQVIGQKIAQLWDQSGLTSVYQRNDVTALKLHVGEPGTRTFVSPAVAAATVRCLLEAETRPFLTDSSVLYRSPRDNGVGHAGVARKHGFTFNRVGADFFPADGPTGSDGIEVRVDGKHFESVTIAAGIIQAHSVLVLSHATGHLGTGFGGALKNLGMGCVTKGAKLRQHSGHHPTISPETCNACEACAGICPAAAITVEAAAKIDADTCIGCGECIAVCPEGAVEIDWPIMGNQLQERIVEHAAAVTRRQQGHIAYLTVAMNITKDCDCLGLKQPPLCEDIGILASLDPVAIDQAVMQLVLERAGKSVEAMSYPRHDASIQIQYAEQFGVGSSEVELVTIEA